MSPDPRAETVPDTGSDGSRPPSRLRPRERLLLLACRHDAEQELSADRMRRIADPVPWSGLVGTAERHEVLGLVLSTLERSGVLEDLPPERARALRSPLQVLSRQSLLWDMERQRLAALFDRRGLDPVWLKGGALRGTAYPRSLERRVGDFDLLVEPDRVEAALEALEAAGYESPQSDRQRAAMERHHYHYRLEHPAGFVAELHWGLTRPSAPYHLDPVAFLRGARPLELPDGVRIRGPAAGDMLLHCAAQNYEGAFGHLRRLVDLDRILGRGDVTYGDELDWDAVIRSARRARLGGAMAFSLQLARALLGTPVPGGALADLAEPTALRLHTSLMLPVEGLLRQQFRRRPAAAWLLTLWLAPDWSTRRELAVRRLTGTDRPLAWLWEEEEEDAPGEHTSSLLAGPRKLGKAVVYQLWLYLRGLAKAVTSDGRRALRFWS